MADFAPLAPPNLGGTEFLQFPKLVNLEGINMIYKIGIADSDGWFRPPRPPSLEGTEFLQFPKLGNLEGINTINKIKFIFRFSNSRSKKRWF